MMHPEPSYLAGQYSQQGWWYYFPIAYLIKTPVSLLIMAAIGGWTLVARRRELGVVNAAFVGLPIAVYLGSAMSSHLDIGVRHILPIDPLVLLLAAAAAGRLLTARLSSRLVFAGLVLVWVIRFSSVYPDRLAYFSRLVGGPEHGLEYLADSNLDWGQDLKSLKAWMETHHVADINLAYFGQADPAYYGIKCTYLPGGPDFAASAIERPRLPGYVAISATVLSGVYLDPAWRLYYGGFRNRAPAARIGYSIHVYWVDRWPDMGDPADPSMVEAEQVLANGLLKQAWYTRAIVHYRRYLAHHPNRTSALNSLGVALAASGQSAEALALFRQSVEIDPNSLRSRLYLAIALVDGGQPGEALVHARRAVELRPGDPLVHRVFGRALAAAGNLPGAVFEYQRAVELDPGDARTKEDLNRLRVLVNDKARRQL
jgi:tetratricopeptide (TPR) repeat protein